MNYSLFRSQQPEYRHKLRDLSASPLSCRLFTGSQWNKESIWNCFSLFWNILMSWTLLMMLLTEYILHRALRSSCLNHCTKTQLQVSERCFRSQRSCFLEFIIFLFLFFFTTVPSFKNELKPVLYFSQASILVWFWYCYDLPFYLLCLYHLEFFFYMLYFMIWYLSLLIFCSTLASGFRCEKCNIKNKADCDLL